MYVRAGEQPITVAGENRRENFPTMGAIKVDRERREKAENSGGSGTPKAFSPAAGGAGGGLLFPSVSVRDG